MSSKETAYFVNPKIIIINLDGTSVLILMVAYLN